MHHMKLLNRHYYTDNHDVLCVFPNTFGTLQYMLWITLNIIHQHECILRHECTFPEYVLTAIILITMMFFVSFQNTLGTLKCMLWKTLNNIDRHECTLSKYTLTAIILMTIMFFVSFQNTLGTLKYMLWITRTM